MTTETNQLPPCPLPDCEGGEHHFHDVEAWPAERDKTHDCATHARDGFRCYGPSVPQWQPIEYDQIRAGMRIRATTVFGDGATNLTGVYPTTYEVDPDTIPDPDAELIEKLAGLLDLTDREDAREVIAAVRAHDEAVTGDE